jgi:DNA-binding PadR family transcriptional regulator
MKAERKPPEPSTLGYALLGLLARGAQSGYDLAQGLKDPVAFFWSASHSQIYPELARLEDLGLVQYTVVPQSDRPDKKVYALTNAGHSSLKTWLEGEQDVPKKRDELVLKAYSIWLSDPAAAARLMREHAHAHATQRAEFERRLARLEVQHGHELWQPGSPWFGVHAVLRRGIGFEREYAEWCEWVATALEARETLE